MKKIYALLIFIIIGLKLIANPIVLPSIEISELFFDNSDNWKLELGYYNANQNGLTIDSIFLYSTSDTVKLPSYSFVGTTGVFVLTNDSLDTEFQIKRYSDTIKVVSYSMGHPIEDLLIFGNSQGATINFPRAGQSISKYWIYFVKDNSPSIGIPNDTLGIYGTVKGIIYDKYSVPIANQEFRLDNSFETSSSGEYSTRVYSKPSSFNKIRYPIGQTMRSVLITGIAYVMEPDSIIEIDIHLLDTLATGINNLTLSASPVKIYPNPISASSKLNIEIDLPIKTSNIWIEITNINGQLIRKERIQHLNNQIETPANSGIYILKVLLDKQIISSKKIIVKNE